MPLKEGFKKMNLNVEVKLHTDFKAVTAAQGKSMTACAAGVHPGLRPEAPVAGAALERPLVLSASARRPYLEAESERLNYRWEDEVCSAIPDWEQLKRWDSELQG